MFLSMSKKISSDEKFQNTEFDLFSALSAIDNKDYRWWDNLTEEQQRKFVPYMLLQWATTIKGNKNIAQYYVLSGNEYANKHMFNELVQNHPKLQWLMLCSMSPGMGKQFHQWLPHLNNKIGSLREEAKYSIVKEYFSKISGDGKVVEDCAKEFTEMQNHKWRIAQHYPSMKLEDIEVLALHLSKEEVDEYEREIGHK